MGDLVAILQGRVVPGKGEAGPVLGFPTLNLEPDPPVDLRHGVYGAAARRDGRRRAAVLYVGTRPTFDDDDRVSWEVHLVDVDPEVEPLLEAERLEVAVRFFVRPDRAFPTVDALREQQGRDLDEVRRRLVG